MLQPLKSHHKERLQTWDNWTTPHGPESKESKYIETVRDCYLHQHINESTRIRGMIIRRPLTLFSQKK